MKLRNIISIICLVSIVNVANAQIEISSDSIKSSLCHKWGFKAIIMGGQRLTNMNESVTYDFASDGTFKRLSSKGKTENGTWTYEAERKIILLKIKKTVLYISSLTSEELIVAAGDGKEESKNSLGIATVFKNIDNN